MTDQPKPLTGTTVVTLAVNLPGPLAASRLVEYGARVIKVEPPAGDPLGLMVPDWYGELAAGQEVVKLDLKDAADRARLDEILAEADLLLTSFRPSANERLGLPASAEKHGLAYVEIVGSTSHPDHSGHDLTYQAAFGTVVPPAMPPLPIADLLGAERATSTCLAMLRARELGRPATAQVALEDAAQWASGAMRLTGPGAILNGILPNYNIYPTSDGWVAVGALEPHFAARLAEHVAPDDRLAETFKTRTSDDWEAFGNEHDIPLVAVRRSPHSPS